MVIFRAEEREDPVSTIPNLTLCTSVTLMKQYNPLLIPNHLMSTKITTTVVSEAYAVLVIRSLSAGRELRANLTNRVWPLWSHLENRCAFR